MILRKLLPLAAVILFLLLSALQAGKPLLLDNMDFPAVAEATSQSGLPLYYRGEGHDRYLGLYHPPLYIYTLAGWYKVFGVGSVSTRLFGALLALLQGLLTLRLIRVVFGDGIKNRVQYAFWPLFLLNPYSIQIPAIADIDATVYGPVLVAMVTAFLQFGYRNGRRETLEFTWDARFAAIILTALALWAKLTTVLIVFPFVFAILYRRGQLVRLILNVIGCAAAGVMLFVVTYWMYGLITGLNVQYTWNFLLYSLKERGNSGTGRLASTLNNLDYNVPFTLRWTGWVTWLAVLGVFARAAWKGFVRNIAEQRTLAMVLAIPLAVIVYYWGQLMPFGGSPQKYHFVFWGLFCFALALPFSSEKEGDSLWTKGVYGFAWLFCFVIGRFLFQDAHILSQGLANDLLPMLFPVGVGLVLSVPFLVGKKFDQVWRAIVIANAGVLAGIAAFQATTSHATTYNYGQTGFEDAVGYVRSNTTDDDLVLSMKDIGYAADRKFRENYGMLYDKTEREKTLARLKAGAFKLAIFSSAHGEDNLNAAFNKELREALHASCNLVASPGDFLIFRPKASNNTSR